MHVGTDWQAADFTHAPLAAEASVFAGRGFLEAWWGHFGAGELHLVEDEDALLALQTLDGLVRFVGDEDLTDYHVPRGAQAGRVLGAFLATRPPPTPFRFDSMPGEVAEELRKHLPESTVCRRHEAAHRLALPASFDEWLATRRKKERQELRRKHRRFVEGLGPPNLARPPDPVRTFAELHRRASGAKGRFMTREREAFFRDLASLPETRVDILTGAAGTPVAAAFGFQGDGVYALYNSAYDPEYSDLSPGMVLLWELVHSVIDTGIAIFDFLKGDEEYKLRLGSVARPLYVLEGHT